MNLHFKESNKCFAVVSSIEGGLLLGQVTKRESVHAEILYIFSVSSWQTKFNLLEGKLPKFLGGLTFYAWNGPFTRALTPVVTIGFQTKPTI